MKDEVKRCFSLFCARYSLLEWIFSFSWSNCWVGWVGAPGGVVCAAFRLYKR